jgi:hypothetical protein
VSCVAGGWDSGKIASDQSEKREYGGMSLVFGTRYDWKVRVWDATGKNFKNIYPFPVMFFQWFIT